MTDAEMESIMMYFDSGSWQNTHT